MTYSVEEGGVAVMVCVDLVTGVIGVGGITVTVTNTGGTATADGIGVANVKGVGHRAWQMVWGWDIGCGRWYGGRT